MVQPHVVLSVNWNSQPLGMQFALRHLEFTTTRQAVCLPVQANNVCITQVYIMVARCHTDDLERCLGICDRVQAAAMNTFQLVVTDLADPESYVDPHKSLAECSSKHRLLPHPYAWLMCTCTCQSCHQLLPRCTQAHVWATAL